MDQGEPSGRPPWQQFQASGIESARAYWAHHVTLQKGKPDSMPVEELACCLFHQSNNVGVWGGGLPGVLCVTFCQSRSASLLQMVCLKAGPPGLVVALPWLSSRMDLRLWGMDHIQDCGQAHEACPRA